jgi:hypothetical protein
VKTCPHANACLTCPMFVTLEATTARNRELAEDNQRLRRQLAQALVQLRAAAPSGERGDQKRSASR